MSLLAPRAGTSVLVTVSDEPWLTAGDVLDGGLARLKTGAQKTTAGPVRTRPGLLPHRRRDSHPAPSIRTAWSKVVACVAAKARQAESEDTQP